MYVFSTNLKQLLLLSPLGEKRILALDPGFKSGCKVVCLDENGDLTRTFFKLSLERDKIMYLPTTWTIVHLIDEDSPLFGYADAQILALNAELLILIEYYEDAFAQNVYQMHSYSFKDLKGGSKFVAAYYFDENGQAVLDHGKLSITESI